jgi:translocation protein SEC63
VLLLPQSLVRIPETLMCAMEFITLYTPPEHSAPLEELRKAVAPFYGDLMARSNKTFWQRKVRTAAPCCELCIILCTS